MIKSYDKAKVSGSTLIFEVLIIFFFWYSWDAVELNSPNSVVWEKMLHYFITDMMPMYLKFSDFFHFTFSFHVIMFRLTDIQKKEKLKPRPLALNTVEMLRVASSGLGTYSESTLNYSWKLCSFKLLYIFLSFDSFTSLDCSFSIYNIFVVLVTSRKLIF